MRARRLCVIGFALGCGPTVDADPNAGAWEDDDEAHAEIRVDEEGCPLPTDGVVAMIPAVVGSATTEIYATIAITTEPAALGCNFLPTVSCGEDGEPNWGLYLGSTHEIAPLGVGHYDYEVLDAQFYAQRQADGTCHEDQATARSDDFHVEIVRVDETRACGWVDGFRPDPLGDPITIAFSAPRDHDCMRL